MTQITDKSAETARRERYRRLAEKLREWMRDDSGYDERVAPVLAEELKRDPLRLRGADVSDDR